MLTFLRRLASIRGVRFCEECAEVCTPQCRAQARLDAVHTQINLRQYLVIR